MGEEVYKAFIGNLPMDAVTSDIETLLVHAGFEKNLMKQFDIFLCHDRETGNFKGFGYVTFQNETQLKTAIESLDKMQFEKKILKVNQATARDRGNHNNNRHGGRRPDDGHYGGNHGGRGGGFRRNDRERHPNEGGGGRRQRHSQSEQQSQTPSTENSEASLLVERPRLVLKPRTTDPAELEARKKKEEEETAARQAKLFN